MQEYIICRVCGYIETADKRDKACPACGYPKTVWADYKARRLTTRRNRLLDGHVHPIFVHFPIVFTVMAIVLPFLAFFTPFHYTTMFFEMTRLICYSLPPLALLGAMTGVASGRLRYKTYRAPMLVQKVVLSLVYFLLTLVMAIIAYNQGVHATNALWIMGLGALASVCAAILGRMGSYLFATILGPYVADRNV